MPLSPYTMRVAAPVVSLVLAMVRPAPSSEFLLTHYEVREVIILGRFGDERAVRPEHGFLTHQPQHMSLDVSGGEIVREVLVLREGDAVGAVFVNVAGQPVSAVLRAGALLVTL